MRSGAERPPNAHAGTGQCVVEMVPSRLERRTTFANAAHETGEQVVDRHRRVVPSAGARHIDDRVRPARHRGLHRQLEARLLSRRGRIEEAEQLYLAILESYPDDVESWVQLAELQIHYSPLLGRPEVVEGGRQLRPARGWYGVAARRIGDRQDADWTVIGGWEHARSIGTRHAVGARPRCRPRLCNTRPARRQCEIGFNPFRQQEKTTVDVIVVVLFALITFAFVAWAIFSG